MSASNRISNIFYDFFKNPLIRRVAKNSGYLFSATGITAGISMLQSILAARLLGVAGFGILGTITMFTSVVNKLASFRMSELVIKYVGHYTETGHKKHAAAVFKAAVLVEILASLCAYAIIWALAPLAARYLIKDVSTVNWFLVYGLIVIANIFSESSTGLLQIFDRFRNMAILNIFQSVVTLSIIIYVYATDGNFFQILLAYCIGKIIGAVGLSILALVEATRHWGKKWWLSPLGLLRDQARELLRFAVSTNISASLSLINKDSELLWLSFLRNPVEVGYYKLALSLANLIQLPISPLPQATYPELSREAARKNWSNLRYILRQGSILAGTYTLAASIGLLTFGRLIIRYVYDPQFLPAFPALLILLLGFLVANTFYWNRTALLAIGRADFPAKVNFGLAIAKIAGVILLVPVFGYMASAALLAGSYIIGVTISVLKFNSDVSSYEKLQ